jgi:hypothetical protein
MRTGSDFQFMTTRNTGRNSFEPFVNGFSVEVVMCILHTVGTVQILTEGTVEQLGKVGPNGIYTESDCYSAEGLFVFVAIRTVLFLHLYVLHYNRIIS